MRTALAALPGVRDVSVDYGKQLAVVAVESTFADPQQLIDALEEEAFGGTVIADTPADDSSSEPDEKPKPGLLDENEASE